MCCSKQYLEDIAAATESSFLAVISLILLLIFFAYGIAACLPGIAVTVRRLRDAGYNWPYIFVAFIPFVGWYYPNCFAM